MLGTCQISTNTILEQLGLEGCNQIQLIPSGPYNVPTSKKVVVYDKNKDSIYTNFDLITVPKSLEGISGVDVDSSGIFIKYLLAAGECSATKEELLDKLNVADDEVIRSKIHFLSGTSRVTEFAIGDTTYIDEITCNDITFYENIKVLFLPDVATFGGVMNFNFPLTTCKMPIDSVLNRLGYITEDCPVSRFEISDVGPFGDGQHFIDYIKLDDYFLLKNALIDIELICLNSNIPFDTLPNGKCALNEYDIFEKIGLTDSECGIDNVTLFPPGPYITSPSLIEKIFIDGELVCDAPFTVSFVRDSIDEVGSLICVQDLNIAMGIECSVKLNADVILANGQYCYLNYIIDLSFTDDPGTIVASGHEVEIRQPGMYTLKITNPATGNSCWSTFKVEDKFIEEIKCLPDTLWCYDSPLLIPNDSVGPDFPFLGDGIMYTPTGQHNEYDVSMATLCGVAFARYEDNLVDNCVDEFKQIVDRIWTFEDNYGNSDTCLQRIYIRNTTIDIVKPFVTLEVDCIDDFSKLDVNNNPHPESSGYPLIEGDYQAGICGTLKTSYKDTEFPLCGNGKKIIREWVIIDWCSDQVIEIPQIIIIEDKEAPIILDSLENLSISADPFICGGSFIDLPLPNYQDCNIDEVILEIIYETYNESGDLDKKSNGSSLFIKEILTHDIISDFLIEYIFTDPCGNESRDSLMLTITDDAPPVAVCDEFTVISVGGNGNALVRAETFDDLSVDNCGIAKFEARKLNGKCDVTGIFRPDVRFCCDEVGDTILVEFKVTDLAGNYNICEVRVSIQDKFRPIIECPEDIRLDCGVDYLDLNITGRPEARDNCPALEIFYKDEINLDQCYQGVIHRTWMVRDKGGFTVSCVQEITIIEDSLFTMDQAMFPKDTTIEGCQTSIEPDITGKPIINTSSCSMVDATYNDLFFYDVENACVKILREWTVIDWCQRNESNSGIWKKDQIIKIVSDQGPEFLNIAQDSTFCISNVNCADVISITGKAVDGDGCTPTDELIWSYKLHNNNNILLASGSGAKVEQLLELGSYFVIFDVVDGCDNTSIDTIHFSVIDCTPPVLTCPSVQPSLILKPSGQVSLDISDVVDIGATDNCDAPNDIILSFEKNIDSTVLIFECADLINGISDRFIKIYARDKAGNLDSCELFVQIRDNSSNLCGGNPQDTMMVSGLITTSEFNEVEEVQVRLKYDEGERLMVTDLSGHFEFAHLGTGKDYIIEFEKDTDHDDGVSTLDILMTQRHILALSRLKSPYQIIAADADNSGNISAIDLVRMRRLVLGLDSTLNFNGQRSWRFVDVNQKFDDERIPFPFVERISINFLEASLSALDFMAVKIGDVNGSNSISSRLKSNARSATTNIQFKVINNELQFIALEDELLGGLQMKFTDFAVSKNLDIKGGVLDISENDYFLNDHKLAISWVGTGEGIEVQKGDVLFSILIDKDINVADIIDSFKPASSEWISDDLQSTKVVLSEQSSVLRFDKKNLSNLKNAPNPFSDYTTVTFELLREEHLTIEMIDITGKSVFKVSQFYNRGDHAINLNPSTLNINAGLYILRISSNSQAYIQKMTYVK